MSPATVTVDSNDVWPADADEVEGAVLANWFVREGAHVEAGDTICEIQVEKVSIDVPAPATGELVDALVPENGEFARGDPLARIRTE